MSTGDRPGDPGWSPAIAAGLALSSPVGAPALLLDVDGVLFPEGPGRPTSWGDWRSLRGCPYHSMASRRMLTELASIPAQIIWLTKWAEEANGWISRWMGWGDLPVLRPTVPPDHWAADFDDLPTRSGWWKLDVALDWIEASRPPAVMWADDDLDRHAGSVRRSLGFLGDALLLVRPEPRIGLVAEDIDLMRLWAEEHAISG